MTLRRPTVEDAAEIARFVNSDAQALFGEVDLSADEVRHWFTLPRVAFRVAEREGRIVGYADVEDDAGDGTRWNVDARSADGAAAAALVAWAEEHAGRGEVHAYAPAQQEALAAVYAARGYRLLRSSYEMRIELGSGSAEPRWPTGIVVRTFAAHDARRVYEAHQEAFADHWNFRPRPYGEWRQRSDLERDEFDPSLWFLAEADGDLAGFALCAWHRSGVPGFGWVNDLGVRRPWRRRGLGLALLLHAFGELRRRGATRVGLGVDAENTTGAVALYERAGMTVARRNDQFVKAL